MLASAAYGLDCISSSRWSPPVFRRSGCPCAATTASTCSRNSVESFHRGMSWNFESCFLSLGTEVVTMFSSGPSAQMRSFGSFTSRGVQSQIPVGPMPDHSKAWLNSLMDDADFEGTLVLEQLAAIGKVEDFFDAIDSDDVHRAIALMKRAKIDEATIATVVRKMAESDGEH